MRKAILTVLVPVFVLVLVLTIGIGVYTYVSDGNVRVNGEWRPIADVIDDIRAEQESEFTIFTYGEPIVLEVSEFVTTEVTLENQTFSDVLSSVLNYEVTRTVNIDMLTEILKRYSVPTSNAYISYEAPITLIPEVVGCEFDPDEVAEVVANCIDDQVYIIDLDDMQTIPALIVADLQDDYNAIAWLNDFKVSYTNGVVIDVDTLLPLLTSENTIDTAQIDFDTIIKSLREHYGTVGSTIEFLPTGATESIPLKNVTYGVKLDEDAEIEFIISCIETHESVTNRTPYMVGYDGATGTYVEVSIEQQHAWFYKDGELVSETDIVTGTLGSKDTPTGVYFISERIRDKYLRPKGSTSPTWVDRWMRITNDGVGLHDAQWRYKFGGSIYKTNGSHGCINLPKDFAFDLFEQVTVGTKVVVY